MSTVSTEIIDGLVVRNESKIVYLILDGVGGLAVPEKGGTELQVAKTPNLDSLAAQSICGLIDPIAPGITPGSGPSHLAIFGYDPIAHDIGRGILSALGVGFRLTERDVAARINFATIDGEGRVTDRRAGRIRTELNAKLCRKIKERLSLSPEVELFLEPEKEHRAVLILRGDGLYGDIEDTDPQQLGVKPHPVVATDPRSEKTAQVVREFMGQVKEILSDEHPANMMLLRGFDKYQTLKSMEKRFGLRALAIAVYPMYRGVARLVGMEVAEFAGEDVETEFKVLRDNFSQYDFFYVHVKKTDTYGEDGNFDAKVKVIEEVDRLLPMVLDRKPDVLVVTGDHSTPSIYKAHSWHPVPVLLSARYCRVDGVKSFDETSCLQGGLGRLPAVDLMAEVLSNAGRLTKYGA